MNQKRFAQRSEREQEVFVLSKCVAPDALEFLTKADERDGLSFLDFIIPDFVAKRAERTGTVVANRKILTLEQVRDEVCRYDVTEHDLVCIRCLPEDRQVARSWNLFNKDGLPLRHKQTQKTIVCGNYVIRNVGKETCDYFFGCGSPKKADSHLQFLRTVSRVDENGKPVSFFPQPLPCFTLNEALGKKMKLEMEILAKREAERLAQEAEANRLRQQEKEQEKRASEREQALRDKVIRAMGTPKARESLRKTECLS